MPKDEVNVQDDIQPTIQIPVGPSRFKTVEVTAESGIFKAGKQHDQGAELVIEANAAKGLEATGDVKIIGDADDPNAEKESDSDEK